MACSVHRCGITEQNTLLMEHLASHGCIVLGVTHPHFGLFATYDGSGVPPHEQSMQAMSQQGTVDLRIEGARVIEIMNVVATQFFDAYVRGDAKAMPPLEGYPELTMQTNLGARL